ncbi:hypothetical protein DRQ05_00670 [bacterium]|nr:MAG: hypothetical protein DRQ05_00670 [bacterium]
MTRKSKSRYHRSIAAVLLLLALLIKVVLVIEVERSDISGLLSVDSVFYKNLAVAMQSGAPLSSGPLTFNPFYPLFLFVVFKIFGSHLIAVRLVQALVGTASLIFLYLSTVRLFERMRWKFVDPRSSGSIAVLFAILYINLTFYDVTILATSLVVFFLVLTFYLTLVTEDMISGWKEVRGGRFSSLTLPFLAGVVVGLGATARPNIFLLLLLALPAWFVLRFRRKGIRTAVACLIGSLIIVSVPIAYNASRGAGFVPVTAHGGINLYIGNGPDARGLFKPLEGMRWDMRGVVEDAKAFAERRVGHPLSDAESSRYWTALTVDYVIHHPWTWARLLLKKLYMFFSGVEVPDVIDSSLYIERCPVLKLLFLPFSLIGALAIAGIVLMFRRLRESASLLIFLAVSVGSVVLFFINTRYRLPSVPLLVIASVYFVSWLCEGYFSRRYRDVLIGLAIFLVAFFTITTRKPIVVNRSALYTFLGNYYMKEKEEAKAEKAFEVAYTLDPSRMEARINYARVLTRRGKFDRAKMLYESVFRRRPDFPNITIEYGALLEKMGDVEGAERMYRIALKSPRSRERVVACKLLSRLALSRGSRDEAIMWIKEALKIVPGDRGLVDILNKLEMP